MRSERGSALVVAMAVMMVMLVFGLAALAYSDGQSKASGSERVGESTFNLVDAVMKSELYVVAQSWPGSASTALPASCDASATGTGCPAPSALGAQFSGPDYASGIAWTVKAQDNGGSVTDYYTTAGAAGQPSWDANGDGRMWIRAQATVRGRTRVLVTQVKATLAPQPFPRNVVTAGFFGTNNQGKKVIVDTRGKAGQAGSLAVRCSTAAPSTCLNYPPGKGQIAPDTSQLGYSGGSAALTSDQLDGLRTQARNNSTYTQTGCPASLTGAVVFIESGNCSYNTGSANTAATPGMVVIANGTLSLGGNYTFYGLVYAANLQGSTGNVVTLGGTSQINGAVAVDGNGGVLAGSSKANIVFDPNVFNTVQGYASAASVQGTWREITPSQ
jgi:hypothetical protein